MSERGKLMLNMVLDSVPQPKITLLNSVSTNKIKNVEKIDTLISMNKGKIKKGLYAKKSDAELLKLLRNPRKIQRKSQHQSAVTHKLLHFQRAEKTATNWKYRHDRTDDESKMRAASVDHKEDVRQSRQDEFVQREFQQTNPSGCSDTSSQVHKNSSTDKKAWNGLAMYDSCSESEVQESVPFIKPAKRILYTERLIEPINTPTSRSCSTLLLERDENIQSNSSLDISFEPLNPNVIEPMSVIISGKHCEGMV